MKDFGRNKNDVIVFGLRILLGIALISGPWALFAFCVAVVVVVFAYAAAECAQPLSFLVKIVAVPRKSIEPIIEVSKMSISGGSAQRILCEGGVASEVIPTIRIDVVQSASSWELCSRLRLLGYETRETDPNDYDKLAEAVWISRDITPSDIVKVMKLTIAIEKELKYFSFWDIKAEQFGYRSGTIFVGGTTEAAKIRNLRPWTKDEIDSLSESISREELQLLLERVGS